MAQLWAKSKSGSASAQGQVDDAPSQTSADIHVIDPFARVLGHKLKP
jgi:hypothetical protein